MIEQDLEDVYVAGSHGTVWRAIEVFKIGEMQGTHNERLRIIKLLENPVHHNIQSPDIHKDCYTCVLVELIKGEQK